MTQVRMHILPSQSGPKFMIRFHECYQRGLSPNLGTKMKVLGGFSETVCIFCFSLGLGAPAQGNIKFHFDYSQDTNDFFNTKEKRRALESAGEYFSKHVTDSLAAIRPSATQTWEARFVDPASGDLVGVKNLIVPADTLFVFVGARDLQGKSLAESAPGGLASSGPDSWRDLVMGRGQSGAVVDQIENISDFGPWGGSIAFDSSRKDWYFGLESGGLGKSQTDFLSVAIHELGHVLGIGASESYDRFVVGARFIGATVMSLVSEISGVLLSGDRAHWADGLSPKGAEPAMDPTIDPGVRKLFTELDFSCLKDIGWDVRKPD